MESFTAHARAQGCEPATEVLKFRCLKTGAVPRPVREGLGVSAKAGSPVFHLERLRLADGVPVILEHRWVAGELAPDLCRDDVSESFYRLLEEKYGLAMTGERHSIAAVILDPEQLKLFRLKESAPALRVEGVGYVEGSRPLWYQRLYYRGDRYELQNETIGLTSSAIQLRLTSLQ